SQWVTLMSSTNRVGSSFLANSHMCCTQICGGVRFSLRLLCASFVPFVLFLFVPSFPSSMAFGALVPKLDAEMICSSSVFCPPKPQVSLNKHHAKIDG